MEWQDEAIVLSARRHGESGVIAALLTREHGRHMGMVRGGAGGAKRGVLQPGNHVRATWRARLAEHLGHYDVDPLRATAAAVMETPLKLAGLSAAAAVAEQALPEREPHGRVYDGLVALLDTMTQADLGDAWIAAYVRWELGVLTDLGFGLELGACAATGQVDDLAYVSPRSGRAVSRAAGAPYRGKLLALPGFLGGVADPAADLADDLAAGLALTGYFINGHVFGPHGQQPPPARKRFVERVARLIRTPIEGVPT